MSNSSEYSRDQYLDNSYPIIITPSLLEHRDPFIQNVFRREFRRHQPELFEWKWLPGNEVDIGEGEICEFKDPANHWVNQRYRIGTGRIVESIESSTAINYVDLGEGYRLHYGGFDPLNKRRKFDHVLLLDWLYLSMTWEGEVRNDGVIRLRKFLKYLELMPANPYHTAILLPAGYELLSRYSPQLKCTGYRTTGHTTEDLKKLYGYWLKAEETKQASHEGPNYLRCDCFSPIDPIYDKKQCPFPLLMKNV